MTHCITYKGGYKYQLKLDHSVKIAVIPPGPGGVGNDYIKLDMAGNLWLKAGYAWDGPSGPTIDTQNFMRGSLVHDALYQLMRENLLDRPTYREQADRMLQAICKEDGMSSIRAWGVYQGVRLFGDPSADPGIKRPLSHAPKDCQR